MGQGEDCDDGGPDVGRRGMVEQDVVEHGVVELGGGSKVSVGVEVEGCAMGEHALAAGLASIFLTLVGPDLKRGRSCGGSRASFPWQLSSLACTSQAFNSLFYSLTHHVLTSTFEL